MSAEVNLIGNEGFRITTESCEIYVDAFYAAIPGVAGERVSTHRDVESADVILVTTRIGTTSARWKWLTWRVERAQRSWGRRR